MPLTMDVRVSPRFDEQQIGEALWEVLAQHQQDDWRVIVSTPRPDSVALTVLQPDMAFHASLTGNPETLAAIRFLQSVLKAWMKNVPSATIG